MIQIISWCTHRSLIEMCSYCYHRFQENCIKFCFINFVSVHTQFRFIFGRSQIEIIALVICYLIIKKK